MKKYILLMMATFAVFSLKADSGLFSNYQSPLPQSHKMIVLASNLIKKIIRQEPFNIAEEKEFFGPYGNGLGRSLYISLGMAKVDYTQDNFSLKDNPAISPIGTLVSAKLYPLLKDKSFFYYAMQERQIEPYDLNDMLRFSSAQYFLTVRAVSDSNTAIWDKDGVTLIFSINTYQERNKEIQFIDLRDSLVGNEPMVFLLGFRGPFSGDFMLPPTDIRELREQLNNTIKSDTH